MNEPENPQKKVGQFHLSTAIVGMFAAGGMIWINVTNFTYDVWSTAVVLRPFFDRRHDFKEYSNWNPVALIVDIAFGVFVVLAVAYACEWLKRKDRERPQVMSAREKPQWHLSTAIVMMFTSGGLLPLLIWAYTRVIEADAEGQSLQVFMAFSSSVLSSPFIPDVSPNI